MSGDSNLLPHVDGPEAFARAFATPAATIDRLKIYADALAFWQKRINLVAPGTLDDTWHRHFADSAQILDLAPTNPNTWLDLGSGAGFPGLVIAILLAGRTPVPATRVILLESDQRKCAFLSEVVRKTGIAHLIAVDILTMRIEAAATRSKVAKADVVSARALASLDRLLELASPFMQPSSQALFLKGQNVEAEIAAAERAFAFQYERVPSRTEAKAAIVRMTGPAVKAEG
ncbi:MAG: 16S rRNA (guanine(527)-N(7))-methyltransferase RsmG [Proteobacteria bacterium]|nr:16S rRNA (guanine(527)-N(7))-methyltransferase RsmG [Pseudomonadota bacterium]